MKRIVFLGVAILAALLLFSCEAGEDGKLFGGEKIKTSLTHSWDKAMVKDTAFLYLNQTLSYIEDGKEKKLYPQAVVKLYPRQDTVYYAAGYAPAPSFEKTDAVQGYQGIEPRKWVISQEITLSDGQKLMAEISYDMYSYRSQGVELFFDAAKLSELKFGKAEVSQGNGCLIVQITLNVPWEISSLNESGKKEIQTFYAKKQVKEVDKLLTTSYNKGVEWVDETHFCLFVNKEELWRIAGEKNYKFSSSPIEFSLSSDEDEVIECDDLIFSMEMTSEQDAKKSIDDGHFLLKKGNTRKKMMYSSSSSYFEDVFSYPLYEAVALIDGKQFEFNLEALFKVQYFMSVRGENLFENRTTGQVVFADKTFEKTVATKLYKKQEDPPSSELKRGKVLGVFVSAVFDMDEIDKGSNITKKCVMVRYEKGYEWGICAFEEAFPSSFKFQEESFGAFNSAAKSGVGKEFELARVVENKSTILWYDENNKQLSGIDALTAMIYDWKHNVNGKLASVISDYRIVLADDGAKVEVFAPNGEKMTFNANPS